MKITSHSKQDLYDKEFKDWPFKDAEGRPMPDPAELSKFTIFDSEIDEWLNAPDKEDSDET
jgi:hypothetical protein